MIVGAMDGASATLNEVRSIFNSLPQVFERMHEAGELERHWPNIRRVLVEPAPLSPAVVQALFIVFSVRCSSSYCFALHMLSLSAFGATEVSLANLGQLFDMPTIEPDHERWSRLLKLSWLAHYEGPERGPADYLLRRECSEAEYERIGQVHRANAAINSFTVAPGLSLEDEPMVETFPAELQALVPTFIKFHMLTDGANPQMRPVGTMCSICRQIRDVEGQWFPRAAIDELLAKDMLFSHGLCERCLEEQGVPNSA